MPKNSDSKGKHEDYRTRDGGIDRRHGAQRERAGGALDADLATAWVCGYPDRQTEYEAAFRAVDHDLVLEMARLARRGNARLTQSELGPRIGRTTAGRA